MIYEVQLFGNEDGPTLMRLRHTGRNKSWDVLVKPPTSETATDICVFHLEHAYREDVHGEVWPIRKEVM